MALLEAAESVAHAMLGPGDKPGPALQLRLGRLVVNARTLYALGE